MPSWSSQITYSVVAGACVPCASVFWDSWFGVLSLFLVENLKSRLFVCDFCFGLHSDPFQYDPKKDLACMWDQSNCSVIYTLFKITFLGKWDERGVRPFLWPRTSFPDAHILCILSSTVVSPPALNSSARTTSGPVALRLAVCRMALATSKRSGGGSCSQYSCSVPFPSLLWYKSSQYPFHLSAICVDSVKFSSVADWIHCRRAPELGD